MKFLANDCPQERNCIYLACTRYYFPATSPNMQFTFPLSISFSFRVCFGIYFPAASRISEFIQQNLSYSGKVICLICVLAGKLFDVSSLIAGIMIPRLCYKTSNCKTSNYRTSNLTERRILQNVKYYRMPKYKTSNLTESNPNPSLP